MTTIEGAGLNPVLLDSVGAADQQAQVPAIPETGHTLESSDTLLTRRAFAAVGAVTVAGLVVPRPKFTFPSANAAGVATVEAAVYPYKLVSTPDFMNADVGDVSKSRFYKRGSPNSINMKYRKAADVVLSTIAAEGVTDVAVAGDLVNGRWGADTANTGTFGPVNSRAQQKLAVIRAAGLYYPQWTERFEKHGLRPLAALGDHEIGDDPWRGKGGGQSAEYNAFKQSTIPLWKDLFGEHILRDKKGNRLFPDHPEGPASETAYSTRLHPGVELITLDVFRQTKNDVAIEIDPQQMRWFKNKLQDLNDEGVHWKIVQFHTPVIGPVRIAGNTTGLMYKGGENSELWKVMKQQGVNLVLNGEVHAITAHQPEPGDPVQISHGGLFQFGLTNYGLIEVNEDSLEFTAKDFKSKVGPKKKVWQTDTNINMPGWVEYDPTPRNVGRILMTRDNEVLDRTKLLDVYKGKP